MERRRKTESFIPQTVLDSIFRRIEGRPGRIKTLAFNDEGKFRVLGIEKFVDGTEWIAGEFDTDLKALIFTKIQSLTAKRTTTDSDFASSYCAYTPDGKYIDPKLFLLRKKILKGKLGRRIKIKIKI